MNRAIFVLAALTAASAATNANATIVTAGTLFSYAQTGIVSDYNAVTGATINSNLESLNPKGNEAFGIAVDAQGQLFVSNIGGGTVAEYNASNGQLINANFVTVLGPEGLAIDSAGHLFVAYGNNIGEFNTSNGSVVNPQLISLQFGSEPKGLAVDNHGHLFVAEYADTCIAEYNTSDGSVVNARLVTGVGPFDPVGVAIDSSGDLFVANPYNDTVGEYNSTTGAAINAFLIQTQATVFSGVTVDNAGDVFVTNGGVGEYNASTHQYNPNFLPVFTYPNYPDDLAFEPAPVPEPSTGLLAVMACGLIWWCQRRLK